MSSQLTREDQMLLGEIDHKGNTIVNESENGCTHDSDQSDNNEPNGLIAMAGVPVSVDRTGNKVNGAKGAANEGVHHATRITAKKRGASATADQSSEEAPGKTANSSAKKVKVNTDCQADGTESQTPSPKKRTSPKKKTADPVTNENGVTAHDDDEPKTPSPKKRSPTKKPAKADTDQSVSPTKANDSTSRNTPRQRAAPAKAMVAPRGIPLSWDTADEADRMLVCMKEKGEDWNAIREAWKEVTGQETANSTLPNRYARIKVNMMHLGDGDAIHLLTAKKEAEAEMWAQVAGKMESKGCDKYATAFLQKQFKAFEEKAVAAGVSLEAYIESIAATKEEEDEDEEDVDGSHPIDAFIKEEGDEEMTGSE